MRQHRRFRYPDLAQGLIVMLGISVASGCTRLAPVVPAAPQPAGRYVRITPASDVVLPGTLTPGAILAGPIVASTPDSVTVRVMRWRAPHASWRPAADTPDVRLAWGQLATLEVERFAPRMTVGLLALGIAGLLTLAYSLRGIGGPSS
jgi:hypothetical protein